MKYLILASLVLPVTAHAVDVEVAAGVAQYVPMHNGYWYQKGLPYELHLTAPALQVGLVQPVTEHLDLHLDYVYLGQARSDAIGTTDDNYDAVHQSCIGPCTKKSRFIGHGDAHGIKLSVEPHFMWRGIRFGVEAGIFAFKPSWYVTMIDRLATDGYRDGQVYDMSHDQRIQKTPMFGASIGYKNVELSYQWFKTQSHGDQIDALYRATHVIQVRYRF